MLVALPSVQSSRVRLTISMMVGTPRPSSPTSHAVAPSYSTSLDALAWLPSLAFSRCHLELRVVVPAGQQRLVDRGELRVEAQRRNHGVSHRNRAHVAGFGGP